MIFPQRGVVINALGRTKSLDAVDMLYALGNQPTTLAMQTPGVFMFDTRNVHHAARLRLTAQMTDQRTTHPIGIDLIRLPPPRPPIHLQAGRIENIIVN